VRVVDADALITAICSDAPPERATTWAVEAIDAAPTICCADCAKWSDRRSPWNDDLRLCDDFPAYMSGGAGCSFFERRQG
jgi:hypothetical protein